MARFAQTTVAGEIIRTTDRAVLVRFDDHDGIDVWVPRSACLDGDSLDAGDTDVIVADWWLEKEGLL